VGGKTLTTLSESMWPPEGMYVKNTFEFVDKILDVHIIPNDILVSFDVEVLFPSIHVDEALEILDRWLKEQQMC
jgi:hypothetical protein